MGGPPESMPEPGVAGGRRWDGTAADIDSISPAQEQWGRLRHFVSGRTRVGLQSSGGVNTDMEVLVTVGTTRFDRLLAAVARPSLLRVLKDKGYKHLTLQIGNSEFNLDSNTIEGVRIDFYRFKDNLFDDIRKADLIISHAGAGSCLEALEAEKKLLVVVNDELMHNHQIELAEKLAEEGYLYFTICSDLQQTLETADFSKLKTYPKGNSKVFARYIDELMGFK